MAFARADATTYLVGTFGGGDTALLTIAAIPQSDATGGLKEPIDDAFEEVGVSWADAETASVDDDLVKQTKFWLRLYALKRIIIGLNAEEVRGKLKVGGLEMDASPFIQKIERQIALELEEGRREGFVPVGASAAAFLGGIDVSDVATREADTTRVPSLFTRDTGAPRTISDWPNRLGGWR